MSALDVLAPAAGVLVVGLTLRDVFHTLFHPGGHGGMAALLCRGTWWMLHRLGDRVAQLAGPGAVLLTILVWLGLVVAGFTLVLWPLVPDGLTYGQGSPQGPPLLDALYVSMVAISTLGFGDVVVTDPALRWLAPLEALLGFSVITAAITWITQIYSVLSRRRSLAVDVWSRTGGDGPAEEVDAATAAAWATQLAAVDVDLVQNTETFWFRESDPRLSLLPALGRLDTVAEQHAGCPEGRHLARALAVLRETLQEQYGARAGDSPAY